jgi:hypothetical protein
MKNKKAAISELIRNLILVVLFIVLLVGVGLLLRKILT